MLAQFRKTLSEIPTGGLTLDPTIAANANLRMVSATREEAGKMAAAEIAAFLIQAADSLNELRKSEGLGADAIFYAWVDEMAGQLRFSVVSSMPLPFGCSIRVVNDPEIVARQFLNCPYLDGIPIRSLECTDGSWGDSDDESAVLDVFATRLPRSAAALNGDAEPPLTGHG